MTSYKLEIFCPKQNLDEILSALAASHAGEIGKYDHCTSIVEVEGTYRPLPGSHPAIGEVERLFRGTELKIELTLPMPKGRGFSSSLMSNFGLCHKLYSGLKVGDTLNG